MSKELSGILVLNEISEDNGVNWKTIVCEDTSTINGSSATSTKKTKCKTISNTSVNPTTANGSGLASADLDPDQVSYQRMQQLRDAKTTILFRRMNAADADTGLLAGELTYAKFDALITEVTETSNSEDSVSFTWTVTSSGDVDWNNES